MTIVDDRILEYLHEHETGSPTEIHEKARIRYTPEYVAKRCRELTDYGLIRHLGNAVYMITEDGERYLTGELDTGELDDDPEKPASA